MKQELEECTHAMAEHLVASLGEKVDLIIRYGSTVRNLAHESSDIDICWIPASEDDWECITVEVEQTLIDLFAIHWSRLERMADLRDPIGTILLHHNIIYARNEEVRTRFTGLIDTLRNQKDPANRKALQERAFTLFAEAGYPFYQLTRCAGRDEMAGALHAASALDAKLAHCLAALNQCTVDTRRNNEMDALDRRPANLAQLRCRLLSACSPDALVQAAQELIEEIRTVLLYEQAQVCQEPASFCATAGQNGIAELLNDFRHAAHAAALADIPALRNSLANALWELRFQIGQGLTGRWFNSFNSLSELTPILDGLPVAEVEAALISADCAAAEAACHAMNTALEQMYREKGCQTHCFESKQELLAWLAEVKL